MGELTRRALTMAALAGAVAPAAAAQEPGARALDGPFEVCIGVPADSLDGEIAHWRLFGFEARERGALSRSEALVLYGWGSAVTSVRLRHRAGAGAGQIRLMAWETPSGRGAGLSPTLSPGARWLSLRTEALEAIWVHAEAAAAAGDAIDFAAPHWIADGAPGAVWSGAMPGRHVLRVFEPLRRRLFVSALDLPSPAGAVDAASPFRSTQVIEAGLVVAGDDPDPRGFYRETLGLPVRSGPQPRPYATISMAERAMMALAPGDGFVEQAFANSAQADPTSGIRLTVRASPAGRWPAVEANPGALGLTHFTFRTRDAAAWRNRLRASAARGVSSPTANEFGELSLAFQAPDGSAWGLVEA